MGYKYKVLAHPWDRQYYLSRGYIEGKAFNHKTGSGKKKVYCYFYKK